MVRATVYLSQPNSSLEACSQVPNTLAEQRAWAGTIAPSTRRETPVSGLRNAATHKRLPRHEWQSSNVDVWARQGQSRTWEQHRPQEVVHFLHQCIQKWLLTCCACLGTRGCAGPAASGTQLHVASQRRDRRPANGALPGRLRPAKQDPPQRARAPP